MADKPKAAAPKPAETPTSDPSGFHLFAPSPEPEAAPPPPAEPTAPSMAMTKDELLDALTIRAEGLTKAEILDAIHYLDGEAPTGAVETAPAPPPAAPLDTERRVVMIDGVTYSWHAGDEATVPEEARAIWARSR